MLYFSSKIPTFHYWLYLVWLCMWQINLPWPWPWPWPGRRYRALSTRTTRHRNRNSFFPQAIHLMNTWHKRGTHNTIIHYLFTTHTYLFFSFQFCTYQTFRHIIVYIIYCVFTILYIAYLYICILFFLLSVSCPVAVILLHCGASVSL